MHILKSLLHILSIWRYKSFTNTQILGSGYLYCWNFDLWNPWLTNIGSISYELSGFIVSVCVIINIYIHIIASVSVTYILFKKYIIIQNGTTPPQLHGSISKFNVYQLAQVYKIIYSSMWVTSILLKPLI